MSRRTTIGFDRRIDLEWLDAAAAQAASGAPADEMRAYLWNLLDGVVSGDKINSARGKTITVLNHIWGEVPDTARRLRQRAATVLSRCTPEERLALHWAMMVGTYPLFSDVSSATGNLLTLQGKFSLAHLVRRVASTWGHRSTLERAVQRIIRSMVRWDVLQESAPSGTYEAAARRRLVRADVAAVLIEALLIDMDGASVPVDQAVRHSVLFPFVLEVHAGDLRRADHFEVHRLALSGDVVGLRRGRVDRAGA